MYNHYVQLPKDSLEVNKAFKFTSKQLHQASNILDIIFMSAHTDTA